MAALLVADSIRTVMAVRLTAVAASLPIEITPAVFVPPSEIGTLAGEAASKVSDVFEYQVPAPAPPLPMAMGPVVHCAPRPMGTGLGGPPGAASIMICPVAEALRVPDSVVLSAIVAVGPAPPPAVRPTEVTPTTETALALSIDTAPAPVVLPIAMGPVANCLPIEIDVANVVLAASMTMAPLARTAACPSATPMTAVPSNDASSTRPSVLLPAPACPPLRRILRPFVLAGACDGVTTKT